MELKTEMEQVIDNAKQQAKVAYEKRVIELHIYTREKLAEVMGFKGEIVDIEVNGDTFCFQVE